MSGGHFNYAQFRLRDISEEIEELVKNNDYPDQNEWGEDIGNHFSEETIKEFREAVRLLKKAEIYSQRIDWLVSGDDSEDNFHRRLKADLEEME
jgi:hypothetical protein